MDYREPGHVLVNLKPVALQPLGWKMLSQLAHRPGEVISYEELYDELWGETIVEWNQLSFQKTGVLNAIAAAAPNRRNLILTFPKRGFMLDLSHREVLMLPPTITATGHAPRTWNAPAPTPRVGAPQAFAGPSPKAPDPPSPTPSPQRTGDPAPSAATPPP